MANRLQIRMLSRSGELINSINCFGGQITVLRAYSESDLLPYQRALSGRQGPERFSLLLNQSDFEPHKHTCIGFGEILPANLSLTHFLAHSGIPQEAHDSLLFNYDLHQYADRLCRDLPASEVRRVQLLVSLYSDSIVSVLNNPFEPLQSHWRERFAELLLHDAIERERILVIPSLTYRPQCWIGNERINRVQVGENIQKTIGFAGGESQVAQMVSQFRELLKDEGAVQQILDSQKLEVPKPVVPERAESMRAPIANKKSTTDHLESISKALTAKTSAIFSSRRSRLTALGALGIGCLLLAILIGGKSGKQEVVAVPVQPSLPTTQVAAIQPEDSEEQVISKDEKLKKTETDEPDLTVMPEIEEPEYEPTPLPKPRVSENIINHYPKPIQVALLAAIRGERSTDSSIIQVPEPQIEADRSIQRKAQDLNPFEALKGVGEKGIKVSPEGPSRPIRSRNDISEFDRAMTPSDIERHERIRQKFLEAINRAVEERQRD